VAHFSSTAVRSDPKIQPSYDYKRYPFPASMSGMSARRQPITGLSGIKPRLRKPNGKLSREEAQQLDREYRVHRNEALQLRNHRESMLLAKARGQLIEKKMVMLQAAYLLTAFRQRVMVEPSNLARRLVEGRFVEEPRRTEVQEMIKNDLYAMLKDLADLPSQIADPNWIRKIDSDLRDQGEDDDDEKDSAGGFVEDPSKVRRQAEQAERRREQKSQTMRRLRAEGRMHGGKG
jgi:hypothetical protein